METNATPPELAKHGLHVNADGVRRTVADLLRLPGIDLARLSAIWPALAGFSPEIVQQIEIDARYAGYLQRQDADIRALRRDETLLLPADLDYAAIGSLSTEIRLTLSLARPTTLGAASRIPGVTPAALGALLRHVRRAEFPLGTMSPPPADRRAAFLDACPVSRETVSLLEHYEAMLIERNRSLSLVSDSTIDVMWSRHFLDSAQLHALIPQPERPVIDLGAGAGFPGLVLAIMGVSDVHLVENNMQKVAFLRDVSAALDLPVTIHAMKAQSVKPFPVGVVTSRALTQLDPLIGMSRKFLGPGSVCVFPKGRKAADELQAAERHWRMKIERFTSRTDPESTIFRLSDIAEARG